MPAPALKGGSRVPPLLDIFMHQPLLLALLEKVYWLDDALQDRFESQGFPRATRSDIFILLNIASGTTYATDIARNLGISRQAVSLKLIELQDRGMVLIEEDATDRRSKRVSFTKAFQVNADLCVTFMKEIEGALESTFGKKPMRYFLNILSEDWSIALQENAKAAKGKGKGKGIRRRRGEIGERKKGKKTAERKRH